MITEQYEQVEIEIIDFKSEDVITTSCTEYKEYELDRP